MINELYLVIKYMTEAGTNMENGETREVVGQIIYIRDVEYYLIPC